MATTFIDTSLLTGMQFIFSFILVWIIVYSVLGFTQLFKTNQGLRGLLAIMVALLTLASPKVLMVVSLIVPWFSILFVFIAMLLLGVMLFGIEGKTITKWVEEKDNVTVNFIIVVAGIIFIAGLGYVFFSGGPTTQQNVTQTTITSAGTVTTADVGGTGAGALMATLFHPKVLGAIFVLLLGLFTILLLVK